MQSSELFCLHQEKRKFQPTRSTTVGFLEQEQTMGGVFTEVENECSRCSKSDSFPWQRVDVSSWVKIFCFPGVFLAPTGTLQTSSSSWFSCLGAIAMCCILFSGENGFFVATSETHSIAFLQLC